MGLGPCQSCPTRRGLSYNPPVMAHRLQDGIVELDGAGNEQRGVLWLGRHGGWRRAGISPGCTVRGGIRLRRGKSVQEQRIRAGDGAVL